MSDWDTAEWNDTAVEADMGEATDVDVEAGGSSNIQTEDIEASTDADAVEGTHTGVDAVGAGSERDDISLPSEKPDSGVDMGMHRTPKTIPLDVGPPTREPIGTNVASLEAQRNMSQKISNFGFQNINGRTRSRETLKPSMDRSGVSPEKVSNGRKSMLGLPELSVEDETGVGSGVSSQEKPPSSEFLGIDSPERSVEDETGVGSGVSSQEKPPSSEFLGIDSPEETPTASLEEDMAPSKKEIDSSKEDIDSSKKDTDSSEQSDSGIDVEQLNEELIDQEFTERQKRREDIMPEDIAMHIGRSNKTLGDIIPELSTAGLKTVDTGGDIGKWSQEKARDVALRENLIEKAGEEDGEPIYTLTKGPGEWKTGEEQVLKQAGYDVDRMKALQDITNSVFKKEAGLYGEHEKLDYTKDYVSRKYNLSEREVEDITDKAKKTVEKMDVEKKLEEMRGSTYGPSYDIYKWAKDLPRRVGKIDLPFTEKQLAFSPRSGGMYAANLVGSALSMGKTPLRLIPGEQLGESKQEVTWANVPKSKEWEELQPHQKLAARGGGFTTQVGLSYLAGKGLGYVGSKTLQSIEPAVSSSITGTARSIGKISPISQTNVETGILSAKSGLQGGASWLSKPAFTIGSHTVSRGGALGATAMAGMEGYKVHKMRQQNEEIEEQTKQMEEGVDRRAKWMQKEYSSDTIQDKVEQWREEGVDRETIQNRAELMESEYDPSEVQAYREMMKKRNEEFEEQEKTSPYEIAGTVGKDIALGYGVWKGVQSGMESGPWPLKYHSEETVGPRLDLLGSGQTITTEGVDPNKAWLHRMAASGDDVQIATPQIIHKSPYKGLVWETDKASKPLIGWGDEGFTLGTPDMGFKTWAETYGNLQNVMYQPGSPTSKKLFIQAAKGSLSDEAVDVLKNWSGLREGTYGVSGPDVTLDDLNYKKVFKYQGFSDDAAEQAAKMVKNEFKNMDMEVVGSTVERPQMVNTVKQYMDDSLNMSDDEINTVINKLGKTQYDDANQILKKYGTSLDELHDKAGVPVWETHDFDIHVRNPSSFGQRMSQKLKNIQGVSDDMVQLERGGSIRGPKGHLFDVKPINKQLPAPPSGSFQSPSSGRLGWGWSKEGLVNLSDDAYTHPMSEQASRRMEGGLTWQQGRLMPKHWGRIKDIFRAPYLERNLATYGDLTGQVSNVDELRGMARNLQSAWKKYASTHWPEEQYQQFLNFQDEYTGLSGAGSTGQSMSLVQPSGYGGKLSPSALFGSSGSLIDGEIPPALTEMKWSGGPAIEPSGVPEGSAELIESHPSGGIFAGEGEDLAFHHLVGKRDYGEGVRITKQQHKLIHGVDEGKIPYGQLSEKQKEFYKMFKPRSELPSETISDIKSFVPRNISGVESTTKGGTEKEGITMYHGTPTKNVDSILSEGLGVGQSGKVWLTGKESMARNFGESVFGVHLTPSEVKTGEFTGHPWITSEFTIAKDFPPSRLSLVSKKEQPGGVPSDYARLVEEEPPVPSQKSGGQEESSPIKDGERYPSEIKEQPQKPSKPETEPSEKGYESPGLSSPGFTISDYIMDRDRKRKPSQKEPSREKTPPSSKTTELEKRTSPLDIDYSFPGFTISDYIIRGDRGSSSPGPSSPKGPSSPASSGPEKSPSRGLPGSPDYGDDQPLYSSYRPPSYGYILDDDRTTPSPTAPSLRSVQGKPPSVGQPGSPGPGYYRPPYIPSPVSTPHIPFTGTGFPSNRGEPLFYFKLEGEGGGGERKEKVKDIYRERMFPVGFPKGLNLKEYNKKLEERMKQGKKATKGKDVVPRLEDMTRMKVI